MLLALLWASVECSEMSFVSVVDDGFVARDEHGILLTRGCHSIAPMLSFDLSPAAIHTHTGVHQKCRTGSDVRYTRNYHGITTASNRLRRPSLDR